jgi:RNA polymerase sigma-70 factor (ECF subfamily)
MRSIARYRAIDLLRRSRRERPITTPELEGLAGEAAPMPSGDESKLHRCLETLSDDQRGCVELAYHGGYTNGEIAASLATPIGTVKSWIRRGLEALKRCMER